jgi:hypothetical protein
VVWCTYKKSLEQTTGFERFFGGKCEFGSGGMRRVCTWNRNSGIDLVAFDALRVYRLTTHIWFCAKDWSDGAELDDG